MLFVCIGRAIGENFSNEENLDYNFIDFLLFV